MLTPEVLTGVLTIVKHLTECLTNVKGVLTLEVYEEFMRNLVNIKFDY